MGFGPSSRIHTSKLLRLSEDLPLVIEIVDEEKKIEEFIPVLNGLFEEANSGGMITIEKVSIIKYTVSKR
jgi:PII-like signaling protein